MAFLLFKSYVLHIQVFPSFHWASLINLLVKLCVRVFVGHTILKIPTRFINILVMQIFFVLEVYMMRNTNQQ